MTLDLFLSAHRTNLIIFIWYDLQEEWENVDFGIGLTLALSLSCCITRGELYLLSEPHFPHL